MQLPGHRFVVMLAMTHRDFFMETSPAAGTPATNAAEVLPAPAYARHADGHEERAAGVPGRYIWAARAGRARSGASTSSARPSRAGSDETLAHFAATMTALVEVKP